MKNKENILQENLGKSADTFISNDTFTNILQAMEEYAKQMCVEQRKMCADSLTGKYKYDISETPLATDKQ